MRRLISIALCVIFLTGYAQEVDIYGYLEPQYTGFYQNEEFWQMQSNRLRIDLRSSMNSSVEFGADVIYLLYYGNTAWNILDFLPDRVTSEIPLSMRPFYQIKYQDRYFLDNAYMRVSWNQFAIIAGKQQISLGTGYFVNPTDIFNVKDALDPTYEQPGHNAIRIDWQMGNRMSLMALYSPLEDDFDKSGKLIRLKAGAGRFDFTVLYNESYREITDYYTFSVLEEKRRMAGINFVGQILGMGVWGEGAYHFIDESDDYYEFVAGLDYTFGMGLYTLFEYHRNSSAESDYLNYDLNDWIRYVSGESKSISRDMLYSYIRYPLTELMNVGGSLVYSISDGSMAVVPTLEYSAFQNMDLTLMFNIYAGGEGRVFNSNLGNGGLLRCRVYF